MGAFMTPPLLPELLGESPGIAAVRETAARLLQRGSDRGGPLERGGSPPVRGKLPPVLIQGETGVGKGLLARALHRASVRSTGPFVDVNCAAIPETLLESELFGYEKGAFTDARHAKAGHFQTANRGTIFLDEVGLLTEALQPKLLTALEDRAVRRLGSTRSELIDVWIITASNDDLVAAIRARRFREDLYHRLAVVVLTLPPLRERGEDTLRLATHFLDRACGEYRLPARSLAEDACRALLHYPWPGNIRELANVMERVALLSEASVVTADLLGLPEAPATTAPGGQRRGPESGATESPVLADALDSVERTHLVEALRQMRGNVTRAAARLGISRDTLRYRMAKHGLGRQESGRATPARDRPARPGRSEADAPPAAFDGAPPREPVRAAAPAEAGASLAVRWESRRLTFLRTALTVPADVDPRFGLSRALEITSEKVQTFGGRVEEMSPTGMVAAFGLEPIEDAPQRAAMAAVTLHKAAERAAAAEGVSIAARSAIAVRRVLVGISRSGAQVDLEGKREAWTALDALLRVAEPANILVEEAAAAFLARHFDLTPHGIAGAMGPVHRLAAPERLGPLLGRRAPRFVGRDRELDLLWSRLEDALRGHGQVVALLGEAGIGKSRLLHEFRERLLGEPERRVTYLEGRCHSYASAIPYSPVMDVLRTNFRVAEGDAADVIVAKIHGGLQEVGIEATGAAPYLFRLFGIPDGTDALAAMTPSAVKARTFEVLRQLILLGARRRPILFVIEDLHWIDSTSEECFTTLMDSAAGAPAMSIVTYRPGYRAPWMDRSYVTQVALPPLSREDSLSVVRSVRKAEAVSDEVADIILGKAEGNPFFLEELSRVVEGSGDPGLAVPDTIQEVLLARIDRLAEPPRRLLQTAAVIGQEVPLPLLRAVWDGEADPHLRELMRLEFLYAKAGGGEPVSAFTHSLTRDVAYESLPTARRRVLHGATARALEGIYADRLTEVYDRLAYHYSRTDEAHKAVLYLSRLADKAVAAHAHTEAVRLLDEARGHVDRLPAAEQDRRRLELVLAQAYSLVPLGAFQDLVTLLLRHQAALEALDEPRLAGPYHLLLGRSHLFLGDQRQATRHLEHGIQEATRCGDDATRGRIHYVLAQHGAMSGRPREGLEHGRRAIELLERAGEPWWIGPAHWAVGLNHALLGEFEAALSAEAQATALGTKVGDPQVASSAAWASGLVHVFRGDWDTAIRSCEEALALSPDPLNSAMALGWLGVAWLERGDVGQAMPRLEEALRLHAQFGFRQAQAWFSAFLAEAHRRAHRLETALELASQGLELARATSTVEGIGWAERTLGHIAVARGAYGDAAEHLREALRAFEAVEAAFEVARTHCDLAAFARAQGRSGPTSLHLVEACRLFRALGLPRWVERAESHGRDWGIAL
jgi:transcriptional regulator with AAA-type ATPase domain/tetratricopeptide (TPR) repeat protein